MNARMLRTPDRSTLRLFGIALLVLALVAGAGCAGLSDDAGGNATDANGTNVSDAELGTATLIDHVPAEQNVVMYTNLSITEDETTREFFRASEDEAEEQAEEQQSLEDVQREEFQQSLDEFENETGLDPREFNEIMLFGQYDEGSLSEPFASSDTEDERVGYIANTGWSTEELMAAVESNDSITIESLDYQESGVLYELTSTEENGEEDPLYVGILAEGTYVMGTESPVRASLDTVYADGDALSGTLRDAYNRTEDGYVKVAFTLPEDQAPGTTSASNQFVQNAEAVSGAYYTEGEELGFEGRLTMSSEDVATQIKAGADIYLAQARQDAENAEAIEPLSVEQEGSDVTFDYSADVETLVELVESN